MRCAIEANSTSQRLRKAVSLNTRATMRAPCAGGLLYIVRIARASCERVAMTTPSTLFDGATMTCSALIFATKTIDEAAQKKREKKHLVNLFSLVLTMNKTRGRTQRVRRRGRISWRTTDKRACRCPVSQSDAARRRRLLDRRSHSPGGARWLRPIQGGYCFVFVVNVVLFCFVLFVCLFVVVVFVFFVKVFAKIDKLMYIKILFQRLFFKKNNLFTRT